MDERVAIERISELEDRIQLLVEKNQNYASLIVNYESFLKEIPRSAPDGIHRMSRGEWLTWAIQKLGYDKSD